MDAEGRLGKREAGTLGREITKHRRDRVTDGGVTLWWVMRKGSNDVVQEMGEVKRRKAFVKTVGMLRWGI